MRDRRATRVVHNPVLGLPAAAKLQALEPAVRAELRGLFLEIRDDARDRAGEALRKHKAPMYCYWKAVGVDANHIARALA